MAQAETVGQPGGVPVLQVGEQVRIANLATDLIGLSGLPVRVDIVVALRAGIPAGQ